MPRRNPRHNNSSLFARAFAAIDEEQDPQPQPPLPPPPPPSPPQHELNNNDTDSEEEELVAEVVLNEVDDEFEAWWTQHGGGAVMAENGNAIGGVNHDGITIEHVRDGTFRIGVYNISMIG